jgi:hypothetical protein
MTASDDWYRKETWSVADAAEFDRRLKRSRGQRTQYLKLQAWHLAQSRKTSLAAPAIALANRYLEEDPGGFFEVEAHLIIAEANTTLRDTSGALRAYRAAVKAEARKRGIRCCAYRSYAWFAATNGLADEFDDVLKSMESMEVSDLVFPISQFKYFASLALISKELHDDENARRMARNALEAEAKGAPFARHKDVGVVKGIDPSVQKRVRRLAA